MAESDSGNGVDCTVRVLRCVLGGIINDESFTIETEGNTICLQIAKEMVKVFGSPSVVCKELADWLITTLQEIIETSKRQRGKRKDTINQEKLWSKYHETTSSDDFKKSWEKFLTVLQLDQEPMFYQHVTDETFDMLIKKAVVLAEEVPTNDTKPLTFEEENATRYVGGYVVRVLRQHKNCSSIRHIMEAMIDASAKGPAQEWTKAIDRGGLMHISNEAFRLFQSIELSVRRYLTVKNTASMDNTFKEHLTKCIVEDEDVAFYWCLLGYSDDEYGETCLNMIVDKWVTIRGFSFARSMMEMYKQAAKTGTEKAKSLRTKLFT